MPNAGSTKPNKPSTRSGLNSGLDVLDCVVAHERPLSLTEIAISVGKAKSSVNELLSTLQRRGLLRRLADQRYVIGLRAWEIGCRAGPVELGRLAQPHMARLAGDIMEGVALAMFESDHTVCIQLVESPNTVRVHSSIGDRTPAHCVSSGLAMLATMSDEAVTQLLPAKLDRITSHTLATRSELLRELARIRSRGYAISRNAWRLEVGGVSIALRDSTRQAIAVLNVALPISHLTPVWLDRALPLMQRTAAEIEREFSGQGEQALSEMPVRRARSRSATAESHDSRVASRTR
jgi:DNA-binding IclR family transcriptional regulator